VSNPKRNRSEVTIVAW